MKRWLALCVSAVYVFLYLPLLVLTVFSFNHSRLSVWEGFTLDWYRRVLANDALIEGTVNSLIIAAVSTIVSTVIGTLAAYGLWKRTAPLLTTSFYLSLLTPEIVTGISLLVFFEWIFRFLHIQLGMHTVILAHVSFSLVYVVIVILARLRTFDRTLEEAALDLGASDWSAFTRVTLQLLTPAILAAALLAFAVSFDDYVITSLVAGVNSETLPMVIYAMARKGISPEVNAISAIITVGIGVLILLAAKLERTT
ncbi:MAG: ABC transporter permease [Acidobacteriaceae bacterium]|nr:ABC transporter permease [Acidobacteriaceae bacterium]